MRFYTFTNFYLSSIQQGIQPAHCIHETFVKYQGIAGPSRDALWEWARNHKTIICLNGGNALGVAGAYAVLEALAPELGLPFCKFHEDDQSLNGIMTCCGIVIPERIYEAAATIRSGNEEVDLLLSDAELQLAEFLNHYSLAK